MTDYSDFKDNFLYAVATFEEWRDKWVKEFVKSELERADTLEILGLPYEVDPLVQILMGSIGGE